MTQRMCQKVANAYLEELKLLPDWFVTSKMLEAFDNAEDPDYNDVDELIIWCKKLNNVRHVKRDRRS